MTTYLGKSCSFGLPRVPFVNCRQFMYLVISLLVMRAGCGTWLYQFLIIAYLFTLFAKVAPLNQAPLSNMHNNKNEHGGGVSYSGVRIALWTSAGKELSPWLFICVVFIFSAVLVVHVPLLFGVWGRVWNSIYRFLIIAFLSTLISLSGIWYPYILPKQKAVSWVTCRSKRLKETRGRDQN